MATLVQQPYNLFAQQDFAAGKQAANSQAQGYGANPEPAILPSMQTVTEPQNNNPAPSVKTTPTFTGSPTSSTDGIDYLNSLYTSPQEEERLRKASVANQRILALGDALRHIGNIYHTVNYAPNQQFNSPVTEESERYQKGKALRDAANMRYYSYQQQKAAQEQKARQLENEMDYKNRMLEHYRDQDRRLWARDAETGSYHADLIELRRQKQQLDEDYRRGKLSIDEYNARSRRISAMASAARAGSRGGVGGGKGMDEYTTTTETVYNYDNLGNKTGSTTTKKRTVNGRQQPTQTTKKQLPGNSNSGKKKLP